MSVMQVSSLIMKPTVLSLSSQLVANTSNTIFDGTALVTHPAKSSF